MELATQLVALKEGTDQLNFVERIHELLIPFEYTKLDKIIEIPFTVTEGAKSAFQDEQAPNTETVSGDTETGAIKQHQTSPGLGSRSGQLRQLIEFQLHLTFPSATQNYFIPVIKAVRFPGEWLLPHFWTPKWTRSDSKRSFGARCWSRSELHCSWP
jgi:hypothetical protein